MGKPQTLQGKVAIVSASSQGIGAAIAVELASRGARVAINYPWDTDLPNAETTLRRIRETGGSAAAESFAVKADMSTLEGPKALVEETVKQTKKVDILINNAGWAVMKPLDEVTLDQWNLMVNLNGRGTFLITQAVLPYLANKSRIVNISSTAARTGYVGSTVYCGTKAMVEAFTRCWALELGQKYGCTVNAVCPGPTNTAQFATAGPAFMERLLPIMDVTPMGPRMGTPQEIAHGVVFFCEEESRWITGVCMLVNGGITMA